MNSRTRKLATAAVQPYEPIGEWKLIHAVLDKAIEDATIPPTADPRSRDEIRREARWWLSEFAPSQYQRLFCVISGGEKKAARAGAQLQRQDGSQRPVHIPAAAGHVLDAGGRV